MRRTITLLATTLVVAAGLAGSASAATLYTNAAHTTPVAVNTTLTAAGHNYIFYRGGSPFDICGNNSLALKVTQNSGGVVKATVTARTLNACASGSWVPAQSGALQISGSSITVGSNKAWPATTLTGSFAGGYTENFVSATGNPPVNGVFSQQPTAGASPVSIVLNNAPSLTGPGLTNGTISGSYDVSGSYSLG